MNEPITEAQTRCYECGRVLPEGRWFARIMRGSRLLLFCRPRCLERHLSGVELESSPPPRVHGGMLAA